jgi:hypothetical protein
VKKLALKLEACGNGVGVNRAGIGE